MAWVKRAEGATGSTVDEGELRRALALWMDPGDRHECRFLPSGKSRLVSRDDLETASRTIADLAGDSHGVYLTLNPVRSDLGDRAAREGDVTRRAKLLIDFDPVRAEKDTSATEEEKHAALSLATTVSNYLHSQGWPLPLVIDSGNGWHLLYRLDLPADKLSRAICKAVLYKLADRFDTDRAKVDRSVHNSSRISKLPGTWVRKGPNTPDRPHRMARMVSMPVSWMPVQLEQLKAVAEIEGDEHEQSAPLAPLPEGWTRLAGEGDRKAYARSALEREVGRVATASEGHRNNVLNEAAFNLGQLVAEGSLEEREVADSLTRAGQAVGLLGHEVEKTIRSGLDAGKERPREPKAKPKAKPLHPDLDPAPQAGEGSILIRAHKVKPKKVEWLWPGCVPIGKLTTFAGWGGLGKSFVTMDLAARVSTGDEVPCAKGECFEPGNVLILNTEDDPEDTSVPRLIEAGADLSRVAFFKSEVAGCFTLADLETLDRALAEMGGARLIVIDPATAHMGRINDHRNAELMALLTPLKLWAATRRLAVVLVTHVNKPQAGKVEAMARVVGGVAWVNAVRSAVMFARDPEDKSKRLFIPFKSNNSLERQALRYEVSPTDSLARITWLGEVDTSADDALAGERRRKPTGKDEALTFLLTQFRGKPEWPAGDLKELAVQTGIHPKAMWAASKLLEPHLRRRQLGGQWIWSVPPDAPCLRDGWTPEESE